MHDVLIGTDMNDLTVIGDGIVDQTDKDIVQANIGPEKLWPKKCLKEISKLQYRGLYWLISVEAPVILS